jgi:hypothetical protein
MLASALISLSVAVALLALLDLFFTENQKTWLSNLVIKIWSGLDEAKAWSTTGWKKDPRAKWFLAIGLGLLNTAPSGFANGLTSRNDFIAVLANLTLVPLLVGIGTIIFVLITLPIFESLLNLIRGKSTIKALSLVMALAVSLTVANLLTRILVESLEPGLAKILGFILGLLTLPAVFISAASVAMLLALVLAYAAGAVLYVLEFLVRRIAEYPKGPVLALSAFFGGLLALIKAFGD